MITGLAALRSQLEDCILSDGANTAPLGDWLEDHGLEREASAMRA